ncbi:ATP-binding protein [Acetobacter sp. DsW_063]|uniref:ATP-binding protein n=1 Tax=Acetobacter sp. DsW_063 TaxID=1514894 RepID=UPI000A3C8493|nr:ATP-binding protein [Acetobacter sp. DsW_063]
MTDVALGLCLGGGTLAGFVAGYLVASRRAVRGVLGPVLGVESVGAAGATLEETLDLLPEPALLLDIQGVLRFANAEALAAFGDVIGTIIRHPDVYAALRRLDSETIEAAADIVIDVPVRRVVRGAFRLLPGGSGRVLAMLFDHSEQDAVERVRSDFVAYASHELRTPLAALIGFIETLRGPAADDPEAQQQFLGIMAGQAGRMQRLIDQLLALSRVEMMEHRKPRGEVNAEDVVARVRDESAPLLAARGMTMETERTSFACPGDEDQIVQILLNLVENAVKYASTVKGRAPRVTLSVAEVAVGGKAGVSFIVADNGPGIEARHLPRLTERFYRVENGPAVTDASGYGLGLAIVRHVVDRHEGRFSIESEPGVGTRCMVWLPARSGRREARERPSLLLA